MKIFNIIRFFLMFLVSPLGTLGAIIYAYFSRETLHETAKTGDIKPLQTLLEQGADVNARNKYGDTPLHYAVSNGHTEIAQLLINKGADINAKMKTGQTALDLAKNWGHTELIALLQSYGATE